MRLLSLVSKVCMCAVPTLAISLSSIDQQPGKSTDPQPSNVSTITTTSTSPSTILTLGYGSDPPEIDQRLLAIFEIHQEISLPGTSIYMNMLRTLVQLSGHDYLSRFNGGTYSSQSYQTTKLEIRSEGSALQYRHAILGLWRTARMMAEDHGFKDTLASLNWIERRKMNKVGSIAVTRVPSALSLGSIHSANLNTSSTVAQNLPPTLDPSSPSARGANGTDPVTPSNTHSFQVKAELQGTTLTPHAVFITIYTTLVHVAAFSAARIVQNFTVRYDATGTELVVQHYGVPRSAPPFFTYYDVARMLGVVPKYMLNQARFQDVTFVLEIDGVPVGQGFLRKKGASSAAAKRA